MIRDLNYTFNRRVIYGIKNGFKFLFQSDLRLKYDSFLEVLSL